MVAKRIYTSEERGTIIRMYLTEGLGLKVIAKTLHTSKEKLREFLEQNGIERHAIGCPPVIQPRTKYNGKPVAKTLPLLEPTDSYQRILEENKQHQKDKRELYSKYKPCWYHMLERCYKPSNKNYANYGGRGIQVYEDWKLYDNFFNYIVALGPRPKGYSLDRIDNNGNYEPRNVRWTDAQTQIDNRG